MLVLEAAAPVQKAVIGVIGGVRQYWHRYLFFVGVEEENRALREKIAQLEGRLNEAREMSFEHERLLQLLGLQKSASYATVAARVIGRERASPFKTMVIDRGTRQGVVVGSPVIVAEGVVGKVMEASWSSAKVLLVNDYNCRIDAFVQETRIRGILEGSHSGECVLKYIPRSELVYEGDTIVTSGLAGIFPKGLILGTVIHVRKGPDDLFQYIRVRPAANVDGVEEVLVVTGAVHNSEREAVSQ